GLLDARQPRCPPLKDDGELAIVSRTHGGQSRRKVDDPGAQRRPDDVATDALRVGLQSTVLEVDAYGMRCQLVDGLRGPLLAHDGVRDVQHHPDAYVVELFEHLQDPGAGHGEVVLDTNGQAVLVQLREHRPQCLDLRSGVRAVVEYHTDDIRFEDPGDVDVPSELLGMRSSRPRLEPDPEVPGQGEQL